MNYKKLALYLLLLPALISILIITNSVYVETQSFQDAFEYSNLILLTILYAVFFLFAGAVLYFQDSLRERLITAAIVSFPLLIIPTTPEIKIASFGVIFLAVIASSQAIKRRKQIYIRPQVGETVSKSFRFSSILINVLLSFIIYTNIVNIPQNTWLDPLFNSIEPIMESISQDLQHNIDTQVSQVLEQTDDQNTTLETLTNFLVQQGFTEDQVTRIFQQGGETSNGEDRRLDASQLIKVQLEDFLQPYTGYLPLILAAFFFLNNQILISIALLSVYILTPILIYLLKLFNFVKIDKEQIEVESYKI